MRRFILRTRGTSNLVSRSNIKVKITGMEVTKMSSFRIKSSNGGFLKQFTWILFSFKWFGILNRAEPSVIYEIQKKSN